MLSEKRLSQHLRTFERLLQEYSGTEPLARFLTAYYKRNKQMGSADRRMATRLMYHYFRIGHAARSLSSIERLAIAELLCSHESAVIELLKPDWIPYLNATLPQKRLFLETHTAFQQVDVFPFTPRLSADIDQEAFIDSLFTQPDLFIRLRAPYAPDVLTALNRAGMMYNVIDEHILALPNGSALDRVPGIAGKYEVQDFSSQRTGRYFRAASGERWWDACAGAGGKSLLLMDTTPGVELLVSDVRGSILRNLDERFDTAGIHSPYRKKIVDLTQDTHKVLGDSQFDGVILDVPCSGSGTWARTPEMISFFDKARIDTFAALQRQITGNAIPYLKHGKPLIYITCSVFAAENEQNVTHLMEEFGLKLEEQTLLTGYHQQADTLFIARLIKP
ncbi:RsmB/NOP family class I SAM-dependent RNA methyltransferase [Parapedobacter lycopersici]|uniref:RsmB/NOP family class I SAM-dependent RNA methyltransferase n=1 Tax=Parapedobacter lycopersici TaxID=1864939 RepID=UPI00214D6FAB|nr:RsmB/NOP family class I SAM-dependent RNA methyltransferase [Parapedobacter lycopersici]